MKVVISGFYGLGNTGDEAILQAMIQNLRMEINDIDITVLSLTPNETAEQYKVKSIYRGWRYDNFKKIREIREADLLISGGGGLLQDTYPTKFLFGPLPYYLLIIFLAKLCGTKVMVFSQGIGPVQTSWGKFLMRVFANMVDFITVRDQYSKDLLYQLKVQKPKTIVTADIVFAIHPQEDDSCYQSLHLTGNEKIVAVSVRPWFHHQHYYLELASALDFLIERMGITPVFIPMEGEHDVNASKHVIKLMKNSSKALILSTRFTPQQYLNFFSHCELAIGMRLHFLIFAGIKNIPHIGISYDPKVENYLKMSGMWKYSFDLDSLKSSKIVEHSLYVLNHRDDLKSTINRNIEDLKEKAVENVILLKKYFKKT